MLFFTSFLVLKCQSSCVQFFISEFEEIFWQASFFFLSRKFSQLVGQVLGLALRLGQRFEASSKDIHLWAFFLRISKKQEFPH